MLTFESTVIRLGPFRTIVVITLVSILLSVLLTYSINLHTTFRELTSSEWRVIYGTAIVVPLIIAPVVSFGLVNLVFKIHRLETEVRKLADTDSLTGLLNRGAFMSRVSQLYQLALRESQPLILLIVDIDHFKGINDQYGHGAGDGALRKFGEILREISRTSDLFARMGGDEFAISLYGSTIEEAFSFVSRLQTSVEQSCIDFEGMTFNISISAGLAEISVLSPISLEMLFSRADKALYQAKKSGRKQFKLYAQ